MSKEKPIYIEDEAAAIVELFDDLLVDNGIKVPSPDDDQRDEDNEAALYGETYYMLTENIAERILEIIDRAKNGADVIEGELSGDIDWM